MKNNSRDRKSRRESLSREELHVRFLGVLGLAAKAGKTVCGTDAVCAALKERKAFLVAEASDNSANTSKRINDRCSYYGVTLVPAGTDSYGLSHAVGKASPSAAVALTDKGLARLALETHGEYERKCAETPEKETPGE